MIGGMWAVEFELRGIDLCSLELSVDSALLWPRGQWTAMTSLSRPSANGYSE